MTETVEKLKSQIGTLSSRERADLAHFLILSLEQEKDEDYEAAWEAELARRVEDIKSGRVIGKPATQVFAEIRKKYS